MEFTLHLSSLIVLIGATSSLILGLLLPLNPWSNHQANRLLSAMLLALALLSALRIFTNEGVIYPHIITFTAADFSLGPLLYLYTRTLSQSAPLNWRRDYLHFLPLLFFAILWQWQIHSASFDASARACMDMNHCDFYYRARIPHRSLMFISAIAYAIACWRLITPYNQRIKSEYSSIETINLRWLRWVLLIIIVVESAGLLIEGHRYISGNHDINTWGLIAFFPLLFSIAIGILGYSQRAIKLSATEPPVSSEEQLKKTKYQSSSLNDKEIQDTWEALNKVCTEQKPYLNPDLKIAELANIIGVPTNQLSETINRHSGRSFYDCINRYRTEEAARLLSDETLSYLSVSDVAYQAGFNSNSTFFNYFKQIKQLTPSKYRKEKLLSN